VLPNGPWGQQWLPDFGTAVIPESAQAQPAGAKVVVAAREVQILRRA
jgi:hypothetical protein